MDNNDILRKIRYVFDFSDSQMIEIFSLADLKVTRALVSSWLKKEEDDDFIKLADYNLAIFLNGLISLKRGKKEGAVPEPEKRLSNNDILRKLKIALNLKNEDMIDVFKFAGVDVSKHELTAFFRRKSHKHFKLCRDQMLRNFLKGLQVKFR